MPSSEHKDPVAHDRVADTASAQASGRVPISLDMALDLVLCGVLLVGLNLLAHHLQPDLSRLTFLAGVAGGGMCVLWGVLGRRGTRCRAVAIVTLAAVACVFVRQAVQSWEASAAVGSKGRMVAALMVVLVVFCVGMLANLAQKGKGVHP